MSVLTANWTFRLIEYETWTWACFACDFYYLDHYFLLELVNEESVVIEDKSINLLTSFMVLATTWYISLFFRSLRVTGLYTRICSLGHYLLLELVDWGDIILRVESISLLHSAFYCVSCLFSGSLPATGADRAGGCFTRRQDQLVSRYVLLQNVFVPRGTTCYWRW